MRIVVKETRQRRDLKGRRNKTRIDKEKGKNNETTGKQEERGSYPK